MSTKNTAIAAIAIQAPSRNFVTSTVSSTTPVMIAPKPLMDCARRIRRRAVAVGLGAQQPVPVPHHARLRQRERDEHAHRVQRDQPRDLGLEADHEHHRERGEDEDAVGEREPVAAGVQLAGQVAVLREDRAEHREAVERRVGGQRQDQRRHHDDEVEARPERREHGVGELGHHRLLDVACGRVGELRRGILRDLDLGQPRQRDQAHEHAHRQQPRAAAAWWRRCGTWACGTRARRC